MSYFRTYPAVGNNNYICSSLILLEAGIIFVDESYDVVRNNRCVCHGSHGLLLLLPVDNITCGEDVWVTNEL